MKTYRKLAIVGVIGIAVISASLFMYKRVHRPEYTLKRIQESIVLHDWDTFCKYVDVNAFYPSVSELLVGIPGFPAATMRYSQAELKDLTINRMRGQIEQIKPNDSTIAPNIAVSIAFAVVDGEGYQTESKIDGNSALLTIYVPNKEKIGGKPIELSMRSEGFHYVVINANLE